MSEADVSLVIPARNAARSLHACLRSVTPLLGRELDEIIVVDDGSADDTAAIASEYDVRLLRGTGRGPGAARNLGWSAATSPLVWFVDADCVVEPGALAPLLQLLADDRFVGAGGTYSNMCPDSRLSRLIDEEIAERHVCMRREVDFLATFNVLYSRAALEKVGGFDERFLKAQDAELAFRMQRAGGRLAFSNESSVGHFHESKLLPYLETQARQGYWRMWLYHVHPERMSGDSYSSAVDHLQPPVALALLASLPLLAFGAAALVPLALAALLLSLPAGLGRRIVKRTGEWRDGLIVPFAAVRACARALGMSAGVIAVARARWRRRAGEPERSGESL